MLTYRTFRNSDPPALAALWQSCAGQPGLVQPVSTDLLEQLVFAKLYFDYQGLVLAWEDNRLVGFAHAGFGPNAEQNWISTETGTICIVLIKACPNETEVVDGLLERCEEYLKGRGASVIYGGGLRPLSPFYLGLYGGSELPGVLDPDGAVRQGYAARGYREVERTMILRRDLSGFESVIDRQQMQIRRLALVEVVTDAPAATWWEACTVGAFDLIRFSLVPRNGGPAVGVATFRSMEPSGRATLSRAAGLIHIEISENYRRRGLATFLLAEAFRQFIRQGIMEVEVQAPTSNVPVIGVLQRLGMQETGQGGVWRKLA